MKIVNVRELRSLIPQLPQTLAREGELLLASNGLPIARLLPVQSVATPRRLKSLAAFRATLPLLATPSEQLIREERDQRG